jgi:hypothetical protein
LDLEDFVVYARNVNPEIALGVLFDLADELVVIGLAVLGVHLFVDAGGFATEEYAVVVKAEPEVFGLGVGCETGSGAEGIGLGLGEQVLAIGIGCELIGEGHYRDSFSGR